jgi:hypothetical protein
MNLSGLRTLTLTRNFSVFGLPAMVTRPAPQHTPITTRGIWVRSETDGLPSGLAAQRRSRRKVIALQVRDVPSVPRGTLIQMAETHAPDILRTWRVDEPVEIAETHVSVAVVLDESGSPE